MMKQITPIKYAIHSKEESPIFGEDTLHIEIQDDAGGYYYTLEQICPSSPNDENTFGIGKISLDKEEIHMISDLVKKIESGVRLIGNMNDKETHNE